jgi:O-antigen ligase
MATLALLAAPMLHPYFRGKILWKLGAVALVAGLGLFIFNTETFQERFFQSGHGTIEDVFAGNFKDQGRFQAWKAMWEEAWKQPVFGGGVGASYEFVPQIWEDMDHIHNDYLRIFFEFGILGFAIFAFACVWQLLVLRRAIHSRGKDTVRITFTGAWLGLWVMLISCTTDNTIVYNLLFTNPLFALLGAGFGVAWAERHDLVDAEVTAGALNDVAAPPTASDRRRYCVHDVLLPTYPAGGAAEVN